MKTPFYSIVVPCYNSRKYIRELLESIRLQDMCDDIEVILSDDHSTEPYDDIVKQFEPYLNIKKTMTDYNCCPGNTRQKGVEIATGEWIVFSDHDDIFIRGALVKAKNAILSSGQKYYAVGKFIEANPETCEVLNVFDHPIGWTHAKFFNRVNFWERFGLQYKKDMFSHEDTYVCTLAECAMKSIGETPLYIDDVIMVWRAWDESVSRSMYTTMGDDHPYLEILLDDYMEASVGAYMDCYKRGWIDRGFAAASLMQCITYLYCYMMSFIFYSPDTYIKKNWLVCKKVKDILTNEFNLNSNQIWDYMAHDNAKLFYALMEESKPGNGDFYIPEMTFREFLNYLDKEDLD